MVYPSVSLSEHVNLVMKYTYTHTYVLIIILDQLTSQIQLLNVTTFHYISQFNSATQSCPTL